MNKSSRYFINVGHTILENKERNNKIYFLGAIKLVDKKWKLKFSFERKYYEYEKDYQLAFSSDGGGYGYGYGYGYASSDIIEFNIKEGNFIYFASYLGRFENRQIIETKKTLFNKKKVKVRKDTLLQVEKIEILSINQFEIQCIFYYKD